MARGEYYSDKEMRLHRAWSNRDDMLRVVLFEPNAKAVHVLLDKAQLTSLEGVEHDYEFAGGHAGMPKDEVWAMTFDEKPIETFVPNIVSEVQLVIHSVSRPKA